MSRTTPHKVSSYNHSTPKTDRLIGLIRLWNVQTHKKQDRWLVTRAALLDATVKTLVTDGYAGTTMQRVQARAGVSRGTLTHHFASMQELIVAAVHHVAEGQLRELTKMVSADEAPVDIESLVSTLYRFMSGSLFAAGLELWMAARTDPVLRDQLVPAERKLGQHLRAVLSEATDEPAALRLERDDLETLLALLRGMAITGVLREDEEAQRALLARWVTQAQEAGRA
ncbi:TetR/AcrR family transcriptional regulator [Streptomyces sp. BV286]|uniref:TetR/AcrR family transcriptional regulator n=1 Tax=Streptomyces sp. BV286 TaxID=2849672 RepID=UPI001C2EE11E|nr:TetR/AcrR family transcriptional regulator [Streptomyces sp. BV286]MBV1942401.1 TetR/AcrR family transcriptional regulator [Streptomyces sp. BV286]